MCVAAWHPKLSKPLAAFFLVPWLVRRLWALQTERNFKGEDQKDIFELEAIGPLLLLNQWPQLFKDALWIHFIDSTAAQAALTRGSSSVQSGDAFVNATWRRIASLSALPWFERVASKSNPVGGLSRGKTVGPWREAVRTHAPQELLHAVRDELLRAGVTVH